MNPHRLPRPAAALTAAALALGLGVTLPHQAQAAPARALPAITTHATGASLASAAVGRANNNRIAFTYFVAKGLTPAQSAGIVGNLMQESGTPINPAARQVGGPGMGIAQWSRGARWTSLVKYARATGRSPYALDTQLDFIWRELNGTEKRALRKLRSSRALPAATVAFATHYERCAPRWCHNAKRTQNARKVLASYGR